MIQRKLKLRGKHRLDAPTFQWERTVRLRSPRSNFRHPEKTKLAQHRLKRDRRGFRQNKTVRPLEPNGVRVRNIVHQFRHADDTTHVEACRQNDSALAHYLAQRRGCFVATAGVNVKSSAKTCRPVSIFNCLVTVDDQPRPRLTDAQDRNRIKHVINLAESACDVNCRVPQFSPTGATFYGKQ